MNQFLNKGLAPASLLSSAMLAACLAIPAVAQQGGTLSVSVVSADGEPAAADVRVTGIGRVLHVEVGERATFAGLPGGEYLVEAETPNAGRGIARATVVPGETTEVEVTVSHFFHGQDILVSIGRGTQADLFTPSHVERGIDLRAGGEPSLGETLAGHVGMSSSYHGPGSSRPLIRGLGASRVRVLESGLGSGDASITSPDHNPAVEAAATDRIEIIRGPATLLYGGAAIGGVVNVEDGRIPRQIPAHPLTGRFLLRGGTVSDERNVAGRVDGALGSLAVHLSGSFRTTGDYAIPGLAEADDHDDHDDHDHDDHDDHEEEGAGGLLENSSVETSRVAAGLSYVGERGFAGFSVLGYESDYGIPGGHTHAGDGHSAHGDEDVRVDMSQRRADFAAGWLLGDGFGRRLEARLGSADYDQFEVAVGEDPGHTHIETEIYNNEWEGRVQLNHALGGMNGAFGVQLNDRDFSAVGAEAFVPPTSTFSLAAFLFEELNAGRAALQFGARLESQSADAEDGPARDHSAASGSVGASYELSEAVSLVATAARSAKLPAPEELYSDGPHIALQVYEIGDPDLATEVGTSFDLGLRVGGDRFRAELSVFSNSFADFTYQRLTGEEDGGLEIALWSQADASFTGMEASADIEVAEVGAGAVVVEGFADYVRAEFADGDALPRIPPLRVGGGLSYVSPAWHGNARLVSYASQTRVSDHEEPTDGYALVNASVGYRLLSGRTAHDIVLSGRNLTDAEARSHTSLIKDLAPLPGREVRLTYQLSF